MGSWGDRIVGRAPYALLAAAVAWVTVHAWGPLKDPDVWWHLRLGADLVDQRSLDTPGHWSSFATVPWVPTEPLPEIAVTLVRRVLGLPGVAWVYVATVVCVVVTVFWVCRSRSSPLPAAVATTLFVAVGEGSLTPRPQLVSYLLLLVVIEAWVRTERDLRPRWWLVPLCWLWSLSHGFWFIGVAYGLLAVAAIVPSRSASRGQALRLGAVAVGSGLVVLLNPVGPGIFEAPFRVSSTASYVAEWQHPHLLSGPALTATAMALVVALVWLLRRGTPPTSFGVALLASVVFWAWYAERTMVLAGLLVAPLLAAGLQSLVARDPHVWAGPSRRERTVLTTAAIAVLALAALVVPRTADVPGGVPLALDARLDRLPAGSPVFNDYAVGGWLVWRHPALNQYIDGLITPYSTAHLGAYVRAQDLQPGWYEVVRDSRAHVALLKTGSPLTRALEHRGWTPSASDAGFVLLRRPAHGMSRRDSIRLPD
jgi:hypothetical protein